MISSPASPKLAEETIRGQQTPLLTPRMGQGQSATPDALRGHPSHAGAAGAPQAQDEQVDRRFLFSAILITDPVEGEDPEGDAVAQLLMVIADPDSGEWHGGSTYALEVPDEVAEQYGKELRAGDLVIVVGRPNGGSCFTATEIHPRALGEETGR